MLSKKQLQETKETNLTSAKSTQVSTAQMIKLIQDKKPNSQGNSESNVMVSILLKRLSTNDPELKELILKKQEFTTPEKQAFFRALALNNTVTEADFSASNFNKIDAANFASAFKNTNNTTLKLLILNYTEIGDEGIEEIIKANLHLDKLIAICCGITDKGAEKIAECETISTICLNQNYITDIGVSKIIKNRMFSQSTFLSLASNLIRDPRALDEKIDSFSAEKTGTIYNSL